MTRRRSRGAVSRALWAIAPVVLGLIIWAVVAAAVRSRAPFPGPVETAVRLFELLGGERLLDYSIYTHAGASLARWIIGFCIGASAGVTVAALVGWSRVAERLMMPLVYVLQLIPGLAWIPIAILLLGIGNEATVFMIVMTALAPVAVNMVAGLKSASEQHLRVARMAGAGPRETFFHVLLPGSIPHLMSGLRVGLGNSWRVVVAAEMVVGTGSGLGYSIIQSRWTLDYASAFVCIILICLVGLVIEYLGFARLEEATVQRWGMVRA
ncbi:MAG: ABC transporter permease [Armatimonadota bacterium]